MSAETFDDREWMTAALALARRGVGNVSPNPSVGCVIVRDGHIIGRGWTQPGGRPHAETVALDQAGSAAKGATAYVTLEPCAHHGKTPPCAEALIAAGVTKVVTALSDPDPRVAGGGHQMLRNAGIDVVEGVLEDEARALNAGFLSRITANRPHVTVKIAASLDSRVATESGESKWITGGDARIFGHRLRASADAIMVGIGTVLADDPSLTCRIPGLEAHSPIRIICDGGLRTPVDRMLVATAKSIPTWIFCASGADPGRVRELENHGVRVETVEKNQEGRVHLGKTMAFMAGEGITRILIEGGPTLATSAIKHDLADEIVCFRAPKIIGGDGLPAVSPMGISELARAKQFKLSEIRELGEDLVETYVRGA